jgi:tetratricopeptide (TPR) repeat protein
MMKRVMALLALSAALLMSTGCNKLRARDQLNKGVQAYKGARYEQAIEFFKNAVAFDPNLAVAKLYLATAYAQQYVPGVDSPENNKMGEQAIEEYKDVLRQSSTNDENRVTANKGIASIYFNSKKFDEAKQYHNEVLKLDSKDPETYYSIGVIDWTQAYQRRQEARNKLGIQKPDEDIKDKKVCQQLREQNEPLVDEGIKMLDKATQLRENYDDATAYLNLLYRERAGFECDDPAARDADIAKADEYVEKTMEYKKIKAEKEANKSGGGIVLDENKK